MIHQTSHLPRWTGLLGGSVVLATIITTGCVYENPRGGTVYRQPEPVMVYVQDDYVYYPQYEVYYSNRRQQYYYRNGSAWVWQPAPPHVSVNVLFSTPSVRMDFHDSPEQHHATVIRSYPRNWKQADQGHNDKDDHRDDHHDKDKKH